MYGAGDPLFFTLRNE